jgi:hypothetical protein
MTKKTLLVRGLLMNRYESSEPPTKMRHMDKPFN